MDFMRFAASLGYNIVGFQWPGLILLCALAQCAFSGCARWYPRGAEVEHESPLVPARHLNPDSVMIETVLVRFPATTVDKLSDIWRQCNESVFDIEIRQRLDQNGLRAGIVMGELPRVVRDQLAATGAKQNTDALEHAGLASDVDNMMRQLQCRAGRRKDLIVKRELSDPLTVLSTQDGKHVTGETYEQPSVLFDLRAIPHGDGRATLELTPEIQHGHHRQAFVGTEFGVRPEIRRGVRAFPELKIQAKLSPGQVLLVSSTMPPKALGQAFFVSSAADRSTEHVLLLVRLAETQLDELFAPEAIEQAHTMAER